MTIREQICAVVRSCDLSEAALQSVLNYLQFLIEQDKTKSAE